MTVTVALIVSVIALMVFAGLVLPRDRRPPIPPENGATRLADPSPSAGPGPSRD